MVSTMLFLDFKIFFCYLCSNLCSFVNGFEYTFIRMQHLFHFALEFLQHTQVLSHIFTSCLELFKSERICYSNKVMDELLISD